MKLAGLEVRIDRTAYRGFFALMLIPCITIGVYTALLRTTEPHQGTLITGLFVGLCFAVYHEIAQFVHQLGHALVARASGYPMKGIRYEWIFTYSEYPPNEPPLADAIHIQRSLGGVGGAALMLVIAVVLRLSVDSTGNQFLGWVLNFVLFDSLLLFFASAVLSDGLLFVLNKDWKTTQSDA